MAVSRELDKFKKGNYNSKEAIFYCLSKEYPDRKVGDEPHT